MSLHQRGDSWFIQYWENGKAHNKYFGVRRYGSSEAAKAAAIEWEQSRQMAAPQALGQIPTLHDLMTMYVTARKMHRGTILTIAYLLREPGAHLRDKAADSLTRHDLEVLRSNLAAAGRSANTIGKAQAYISAALAWGVEQGLLQVHPWAGIKKPRAERYISTGTMEDFQKVLAIAPDHVRWALAIAYATVSRPGWVEVLSLQWDQVDWQAGTITMGQGKTGLKKVAPLSQGFLSEAWRRYEGDRVAGQPYMVHYRGKPVKNIRKAWGTAVEKAGLAHKKIRMYDLRHCVITHLLDKGVTLAVVAGLAGHSTPGTTARFYSHVLDGRKKEAVEILPPLMPEEPGTQLAIPSSHEPTLHTDPIHTTRLRKKRG